MISKIYSFRLSGRHQSLLEKKAKELSMKPNLFAKKTVISKLDKYGVDLEKRQHEFFND